MPRTTVSSQQENDSEHDDGGATTTQFTSTHDSAQRLIITGDGELDPSLLIRTEGWVHKKGGIVNEGGILSGRRNWKKRWFVLTEIDFRGHIGYELNYYDSNTRRGKLKGTVGLSEVEIFCEERSKQKKSRYEFQILLPNGRTFELGCDNSEEREEWIETLNMVVAYLRKLSSSSFMGVDGYDPALEDKDDVYERGEELGQCCQVR